MKSIANFFLKVLTSKVQVIFLGQFLPSWQQFEGSIILIKLIRINFIFRRMEQLQKGHILKFVAQGKTFNPNVGIKTFPRQTYGVSEDSPREFRQTYTLTGQQGYVYQHQNKPQFQYPSQQHFFDIYRCEEHGSPSQSHYLSIKNPVAFHRKKGRLSEFMDKNGWMSPVIPIMGFERTEDARALSNKDRQNRINSLKPKTIYDNPTAKKASISPQHYKTISVVMGEKLRIRKKRQELVSRQVPATARPIPELLADPLEVENVEDKMNKTNMQFYSTCSTFFQRNGTAQTSRQSPARQLSSKLQTRLAGRLQRANSERKKEPDFKYRVSSPAKETRLSSRKGKESTPNPLQNQDLKLQEWYRSTCHNKWTYHPKKLDSEEQEEANRLLVSTNF